MGSLPEIIKDGSNIDECATALENNIRWALDQASSVMEGGQKTTKPVVETSSPPQQM